MIDLNELKKITVDIRRNLGRNAAPAGPLRYFFKPEDVVIVRRSGEGSRPIFDREELKPCRDEERVIKLAADQIDRRQSATTSSVAGAVGSQGSASPLPSSFLDNRQPKGDSESDLRLRLMERKNNEEFKERVNNDPNYVPQGRYYYEVRITLHVLLASVYSFLFLLSCSTTTGSGSIVAVAGPFEAELEDSGVVFTGVTSEAIIVKYFEDLFWEVSNPVSIDGAMLHWKTPLD